MLPFAAGFTVEADLAGMSMPVWHLVGETYLQWL